MISEYYQPTAESIISKPHVKMRLRDPILILKYWHETDFEVQTVRELHQVSLPVSELYFI